MMIVRSVSCLLLIAACALPVVARAQAGAAGAVLPPAREGLVPVHLPDLTTLEVAVREQLTSLQNSMVVTAKDPKIPPATLSEAFGLLGGIYQAYSLFVPARECYLNAVALRPQEFRWVYLLGTLDQLEDRVEDAIRHFRIARQLQPDYVAVSLNLGNIYLQMNRLADATDEFDAALKIENNNPAAHYGLGQVALAQRRYADAVALFEKALAQVPDANRIHYSLAMAYRGLGDADQAAAHLARHGPVGVRPADPVLQGLQEMIKGERVHLIRGQLAYQAGRYQEAVSEYRQAVAAQPGSLPARLKLGAALGQVGDFPGATAEFEESLRLDPTNAIAHYNLAFLLSRENKHELAIPHLQAVFTVEPHDLAARVLLAQALVRLKRWDDALIEYSQVVRADPANESALLEQVALLQRQGQHRQALESLERSHAQFPEKGQTLVALAYLLAASPQLDLRNGARALTMARLAFDATGAVEHGAVVALALAELGRCGDAAEWQRKMMAAAGQQGRSDMAAKLRPDLARYEQGQPCRPPHVGR